MVETNYMQLHPSKHGKNESKASTSALSAPDQEFCRIIGNLVEQWGFRRHLGRVWAILYLRTAPMCSRDIKGLIGLSSGNINSILQELHSWGVIERIRVTNDRKIYYQVEQQIWKSVSNVLRTRELRLLKEAIQGLEQVKTALGKENDQEAAIAYKRAQINHVLEALSTAQSFASMAIASKEKHLSNVAKLIARLQGL